VSSLAETSAASEKCVLGFITSVLGVPLSPADISVAHRLRKQKAGLSHAPLIVRFTNRRARNAVFAARKKLSSYVPATFINEHLTKDRASLFYEARKLVKSKKLTGAWSYNGDIFIKLSDTPDSRPIRVNSISDLPRG